MKKGGLQELALRREFVQRLDSAKRDDLRKAVWIAVATLERIGSSATN